MIKISFSGPPIYTEGLKACKNDRAKNLIDRMKPLKNHLTPGAAERIIKMLNDIHPNIKEDFVFNQVNCIIEHGLARISKGEFPRAKAFRAAAALKFEFMQSWQTAFLCLKSEVGELERSKGCLQMINKDLLVEKHREVASQDRACARIDEIFRSDPALLSSLHLNWSIPHEKTGRHYVVTDTVLLNVTIIGTGNAGGLAWSHTTLSRETSSRDSKISDYSFEVSGPSPFPKGIHTITGALKNMGYSLFKNQVTEVFVPIGIPLPNAPREERFIPYGTIEVIKEVREKEAGDWEIVTITKGTDLGFVPIVSAGEKALIMGPPELPADSAPRSVLPFNCVPIIRGQDVLIDPSENKTAIIVIVMPIDKYPGAEPNRFVTKIDPSREPQIFKIIPIGVYEDTTPQELRNTLMLLLESSKSASGRILH